MKIIEVDYVFSVFDNTIIPLDKDITFTFEESSEERMGAEWHKYDPMLKIYGVVKVRSKGLNLDQFTGIAVLIKETEEFTKVPVLNKNVYLGKF